MGRRYTSSPVISTPSGPGRTSSIVLGLRSGPGSATTPDRLVLGISARPTVVNDDVRTPPGVPLPSPSSCCPSGVVIESPSTVSVICDAPGIGTVGNSQAKVPSVAGTIVVGSLAPEND